MTTSTKTAHECKLYHFMLMINDFSVMIKFLFKNSLKRDELYIIFHFFDKIEDECEWISKKHIKCYKTILLGLFDLQK